MNDQDDDGTRPVSKQNFLQTKSLASPASPIFPFTFEEGEIGHLYLLFYFECKTHQIRTGGFMLFFLQKSRLFQLADFARKY